MAVKNFDFIVPSWLLTLVRISLLIIALHLLMPRIAICSENSSVEFDSTLLWGGGKSAGDLSRFSSEGSNQLSPGVWTITVIRNSLNVGKLTVNFVKPDKETDVVPCFTREQYRIMAVDPMRLDPSAKAWLEGSGVERCWPVGRMVEGALTVFDFSEQVLSVSIPQFFVRDVPPDYIDPALFDYGVTAGRFNYNLSTFVSAADDLGRSTYNYAALDSGFNYERWRFRYQSYFKSADGKSDFESVRAYAQTNLFDGGYELTLGEMPSYSQVFDSYSLRGVALRSDLQSGPASLSSYAPVIEGVAESNAQVTVSQNGVVIYNRTVPPGPFSLTDMSGAQYGADLDVLIVESNGTKHGFSIPYNSAAQLLRPGLSNISGSVGQVYSVSYDEYRPYVAQLVYQRGLTNTVTGYGGVLASSDYQSMNIGGALSAGVGAFSGDISLSRNTLAPSEVGASLKLGYSTYVPISKTYLNLATYRYSTEKFWSFNDMVQSVNVSRGASLADDTYFSSAYNYGYRQKQRFDISLRQQLPSKWGGVYLTGSTTAYWDKSGRTSAYRLGYNNRFGQVNLNLSASQNQYFKNSTNDSYKLRNVYTLSVSFPLGGEGKQYSSSSAQFYDESRNYQTGISGTAGERSEISYGVNAARSESTANAGEAYDYLSSDGSYRSTIGDASASVSRGPDYQQYSLGFSGGALAHADGVTFGQSLGDTVGLVRAENGEGAQIVNASGAAVNRGGYGVVPYLSAYRRNDVWLDPKGLSYDVEFTNAASEVIPAAGAIVQVEFTAKKNDTSLLEGLQFSDGRPLPFGVEVFTADGLKSLGYVGQGGRAVLQGAAESGVLLIRVSAPGELCSVSYTQIDNATQGIKTYKAQSACMVEPLTIKQKSINNDA